MSESQALALFPDDVTKIDHESAALRSLALEMKVKRIKRAAGELVAAILALFR